MSRAPSVRRSAAATTAGAAVVFGVAALVATREIGRGVDLGIVRWWTELPGWFEAPAEVVLVLGTIPGVLLVWAPAVALRCRDLAVVATVLLGGVIARGVAIAAKGWFESPRPTAQLAVVRERLDDFGFPSGHATVACALATVVGFVTTRRRDRIVVGVVAALVSVLRWYVGAHYVVDVVGGAALGIALGATAVAVVGRPVSSPR